MSTFKPVSSEVQFPQEELSILDLWRKLDVFKRSVDERDPKSSYIFYDGPPFATGLPHYGHLVASTLKDIVPRYWTMRGHRIERRFGWDTHGLPIEQQIQDRLKLDGPANIRALGVDKFNEACRENVLTYVDEWRRTITRIGRWVDFDNDYKTMDPWFMESVWWAFSELWKKGLVYKGRRVMPYSWKLSTPLSNFEAGQDYRDVDDPALTVRLRVHNSDDKTLHLLIWTTTPWTLPSNLAVAVGPDIAYVKARLTAEKADGKTYVVAKDLVKAVLGEHHEVVAEMKGEELVGLAYEPLFPFFAERKASGAFRVIASGHVTTTDGTGLVHMAPAFGEDDFEACKKAGIDVVEPVDEEGKFTAQVPPWQGKRVKDADPEIAAALKANGALFRHATVRHSYPFCYRTGTPLIYKTTPSWYVSVEPLRDRMVENNKTIHWVPGFVGEKRFENWLKDARDWSISRSRFWGTPIPLWECPKGHHTCVGSVADLEKRTGTKVADLHPHRIDGLTFPCGEAGCGEMAKRISDVFDCWFESGSMPYAQVHYPFAPSSRETFKLPAQFIAEGLDQTRGWFYTLLVLSTALFDKAPFQNCIVNGLVLAKTYQDNEGKRYPLADVDVKGNRAHLKNDGRELRVLPEKMSKRLKNYPDPHNVIDAYGADALRAYLINSPVVRAEPLVFDELGVREVVRTVLLPLQNAWSFFVTYANIDAWSPTSSARPAVSQRPEIDRWILSVLQSLIRDVNTQMEGYYLDKVVPPMLAFIDDLTNWYIRRSRRRFWKGENDTDKASAYATLYEVLTTFAEVLAPVLPFVAESVYQNLVVEPGCQAPVSVHLCDYPKVNEALIDEQLEREMAVVRNVVGLGRALREKHKMKTRQPLSSATVVSHDDATRAAVERHVELVKDELNVKDVVCTKDDGGLATLSFKANFKTLGKKMGPKMKAAAAAIEALTAAQWKALEDGGSLALPGAELAGAPAIAKDDVLVARTARGDVIIESAGDCTVALDTKLTEALKLEYAFRELTTEVNAYRKDVLHLAVHERVQLDVATDNAALGAYLGGRAADFATEVTASSVRVSSSTPPPEAHMIELGDLGAVGVRVVK